MSAEITQVRPAQLATWVDAHKTTQSTTPVLLDVREPWELELACVKTTLCTFKAIPMALIPLRFSELDPHAPIAVMCHHGARSMQVAQFLAHNGFSNIANITGGIGAWAHEFDNTVPQY